MTAQSETAILRNIQLRNIHKNVLVSIERTACVELKICCRAQKWGLVMAITLCDPSEKYIQTGYPAWINSLLSLIMGGLFVVLSIVSLSSAFGLSLVSLFVAFLFGANAYIERYRHSYAITNKRIIVRHGLLSSKVNEVWIEDVRGISVNTSFLQSIIGTGDVLIGTAATASAEIFIKGVKHPGSVAALINKVRKGGAGTLTSAQASTPSGKLVYDSVAHEYVRK